MPSDKFGKFVIFLTIIWYIMYNNKVNVNHKYILDKKARTRIPSIGSPCIWLTPLHWVTIRLCTYFSFDDELNNSVSTASNTWTVSLHFWRWVNPDPDIKQVWVSTLIWAKLISCHDVSIIIRWNSCPSSWPHQAPIGYWQASWPGPNLLFALLTLFTTSYA